MINGDTKISIKELTDWNLHWMCVDLEYGTGKKQLTADEAADFCERIEGRRIILMQQWNTIYDHPTGLREELQKLPNWRKLDDLLMEVRHKAYDRALNTQRDHSLMVEHLPSKENAWVRFPLVAPSPEVPKCKMYGFSLSSFAA